ncbi:hypothetical protein JTE90_015009 [Oedothorax gibbosus]|uniref:Uncharacterized protein n=1 Tax=Oedothorax gibbosus TaxID=931172 RepID=A0AAV6TV30_9ARAC|nr:hypothetical protein JTE90_015009 [Oedothorax gibbosus]
MKQVKVRSAVRVKRLPVVAAIPTDEGSYFEGGLATPRLGGQTKSIGSLEIEETLTPGAGDAGRRFVIQIEIPMNEFMVASPESQHVEAHVRKR